MPGTKSPNHHLNEVDDQTQALGVVTEIDSLLELINDINADASYLAKAEAILPAGHKLSEEMKTHRDEISHGISDRTKRNTPAFRRQVMQKLVSLKKKYMNVYLELHTRARLGANEHKRKSELLQDSRMAALNNLSGIELMPRQHLTALKENLERLHSCFILTENELDDAPVCPHCGFKPGLENPKTSAAVALQHLEDELDQMLDDWKLTLLLNLVEPGTRSNIELLKPGERDMVNEFIKSSELPDNFGPDFIRVLREVLSGLVKVTINTEELRKALLTGGAPVIPAELKNRFEKYVDELIEDKEEGKVRIVLE